uniref:hypothetical protein n=1 Tax=Faecalibacterium prausnitzii TaxID=853 RepID=UPI003FF0D536
MGVFKRYRDAQAAQKDAENAMPGAYQSNYTDRINETLDSMGAASNAGYDVGTDSELYRQYRAGAQANARAAAENAAAGAAALSGGYGSSYANSVAQQGYQQAMANVDSGLAGLRDKALTMYQLKQNGLSGLLSALQNQDSLEAAEHQGAVANAQDWRDYKKSRADQAAQEKQNFWDNLMQVGTDVVKAGFTAYDRYKGYDQWKQEHELQEKQVQAQLQQMAIDKALDYKERGASEAFLNQFLSANGLDPSILNDWTAEKTTELSPADYLTAMKGITDLYEGGFRDAAGAVADMYGISRDALNYTPQYITGSYSSRRSGSSGGSSGRRSDGTKSSGSDTVKWSSNNVLSLKSSRDEKAKKGLDTSWEDALLAEIGYPVEPTNASQTNASQSGGVDMAAMLAKNYAKKGYSAWAIMNNMSQNGYSDDEIARALEKAGVKG